MAVLAESQASQLARATNDVAVIAAVGYLSTAEIHLTKAEVDINANTPLLDLTDNEADFTSYAATALVWAVPSTSGDATVEVVSVPIVFRPTNGVTPNNIWACWISNAAGSVWYFAGQLDGAPLPMNDALDQIIITIRYRPATDSIVVTVS